MEKLQSAAPNLPHALVCALPVSTDPAGEIHDMLPLRARHRLVMHVGEVQCIDQLTIDVQLKLVVGRIADADRTRVSVSRQMAQRVLGEIASSVDAIETSELARLVRFLASPGHPVREAPRLA